MLKKKKGFTLIELLAVIVILGTIMTLIIPKVIKTIERNQTKLVENSVRGLIRAVDIAQKENILDDDLETITFTYENGNETSNVGNLTLEYTGKKPENGTIIIDQDGKIALALHDGNYCIEKDFTSDDIIITKTLLDDCNLNIPIYYTDASGANNPKLLKGMTAIVWDESTSDWVEASNIDDPNTQNWFDYGDKKWANAKTVDDAGGVAYWVWIPRYAYKITNGFHSSQAGTIDIEFLNGTSNTPKGNTEIKIDDYGEEIDGIIQNTSNNYFLHPAFDFSNDGKSNPISGFWMAKFEPSMSSNKIRVVPNVNSIASRTVSQFYDFGLNMKDYICNGQCDDGTDTHMMKNIEWGAVAYLSQSQYGNPDEIWKNAYTFVFSFMTGCSGSSVNDSSSSSTCVEWNTENGQRASTTGNVYGVYDMRGGAWEYVAAYVNNGNGNLTTYGSNIAGADLKYKDAYSVGTTDTAQNNYLATINRYGDAIWETSSSSSGSTSWHTASSSFIYDNYPWLIRGGHAGDTVAGIFFFDIDYGYGVNRSSFRPVALR